MRKRGKRRGLRKVHLIPAQAMALLSEAGVAPRHGDPDTVIGYFTPSGQPCRIRARFRDGWIADLRIRTDGSFSLTQSLKITVAGHG